MVDFQEKLREFKEECGAKATVREFVEWHSKQKGD